MKKELRHSLNWQMCILSMSLFSHYHTPMLCAIQLVNWQTKVTVVSMHMGSPPTIHCGVSAVKINICKTPSTRWSNSQSSIIRFKFLLFRNVILQNILLFRSQSSLCSRKFQQFGMCFEDDFTLILPHGHTRIM